MKDIDITVHELVRQSINSGLESAHFDEAVIELLEYKASSINNGGMEKQIQFLLNEIGTYETIKIIERLVDYDSS